jgi:CHAT domain-containing protein
VVCKRRRNLGTYEPIKKAPIKSEALRQTQLAMLRGEVFIKNGVVETGSSKNTTSLSSNVGINKKLSHPYYWAAFTLIGNPW